MKKRSAPALVLLTALAFGGCGEAQPPLADDDAGPRDDSSTPGQQVMGDATLPSQSYPTRQSYCEGDGPPIVLAPQGGTACTGLMAQVAFRYAICSCEAFDGTGDVSTDGFDHTQGSYDAAQSGSGAALGINAELGSVGTLEVGGPLTVGGAKGLNLAALTSVEGSLRCAGPVVHHDDLSVAGDAYVAGDFSGTGTLRIAGTLTQPAGKGVYSLESHLGAQRETPVSIPAPCDCSEDTIYDIAGFVRAQRDQNDNAAIDLAPASLSNIVAAEKRVKLPCGRFYLDGISGTADLVLEVEGRVALFVGGKLDITGGLQVQLAPGAELDLFIEDGLRITGGLDLGDRATPASVRIYVGGSERIDMVGGSVLSANLYAPRAALDATGQLEVFGSLFVRRLNLVGSVAVHYDRAILGVGAQCGADTRGPAPTAPQCDDCRDCGNQACVEGVCGACREDADCCAPLLCREGRCLAPIL